MEARFFPVKKLHKYPHLMPLDKEIWERYLDTSNLPWSKVQYDVRVGSGIEPFDDWPEEIKRDARALTQKRIDIVGHSPTRIDVIEVKPRASSTAVGQVMAYRKLYIDKFKPTKPVQAVILTDSLTPDIENLAKEFDILVLVA